MPIFFGEHVTLRVRPDDHKVHAWSPRHSGHWYDFTAKVEELPGFARRFAGRVETGRDGYSDPAMGGLAVGTRG